MSDPINLTYTFDRDEACAYGVSILKKIYILTLSLAVTALATLLISRPLPLVFQLNSGIVISIAIVVFSTLLYFFAEWRIKKYYANLKRPLDNKTISIEITNDTFTLQTSKGIGHFPIENIYRIEKFSKSVCIYYWVDQIGLYQRYSLLPIYPEAFKEISRDEFITKVKLFQKNKRNSIRIERTFKYCILMSLFSSLIITILLMQNFDYFIHLSRDLFGVFLLIFVIVKLFILIGTKIESIIKHLVLTL